MATRVICSGPIDLDHSNDHVKLTEKGCIGINNASKLRKLNTADVIFSEDNDVFVHKSANTTTQMQPKLLLNVNHLQY